MPHTIDAVSDESRHCRTFLLHSKPLHAVLFVLLVIDGLICLTCGVLETQYLNGFSKDCEAYVDTCMPTTHRRLDSPPLDWLRDPWSRAEAQAASSRMLSGNVSGSATGHGSDAVIYQQSGHNSNAGHGSTIGHGSSSSSASAHGCGHPHFGNHDLHTAEVSLAYVSIGILCIFLIEQIVLIVELRTEYLKPMFILDFIVILSSLVIELVVVNMTVAGLLVLARTWRFARVGHGAIASQENLQEVNEQDESVNHLNDAWAQLPDERWFDMAKGMTEDELNEKPLSNEELKIAEELGKSPYVALRALALARAYNIHMAKKLAKHKKLGIRGKGSKAQMPVPESSNNQAMRNNQAQGVRIVKL